MVWWRGASAQAGSCRSLNGDRFVVANPLRRGAGIRRRSPAGPLTEELVVNQSSTVATGNTGLSAAPHRVARSSPVTGRALTWRYRRCRQW